MQPIPAELKQLLRAVPTSLQKCRGITLHEPSTLSFKSVEQGIPLAQSSAGSMGTMARGAGEYRAACEGRGRR